MPDDPRQPDPPPSNRPTGEARPPGPTGPKYVYSREQFMAERDATEPLGPAFNAPFDPTLAERYPELYLRGLRAFNLLEMFDCHELLEAVWNDAVDDERVFVQGLIQIAVAILHWESKHKPGALSVFRTGRSLLAEFPAQFMGVPVQAWLAHIDALFAPLLAAPGDDLPDLDYRAIPHLTVDGREP
ncbi:MAG: DUF309 domain-containing protein [Planctomycetota bacterium]